MATLPADGADLSAPVDLSTPDGASKFRHQLIADMSELLREHHSQIAEQVEESVEELYTRLTRLSHASAAPVPSTVKNRIQKSIRQSNRSANSIMAPIQQAARAAARANTTTVCDTELLTRKRSAERSVEFQEEVSSEEASAGVQSRDDAWAEPEVVPSTATNLGTTFRKSVAQCGTNVAKTISSKRVSIIAASLAEKPVAGEISGVGPGTLRARVRRVLNSVPFDCFIFFVILSNAIFFGVETQLMAGGVDLGLFTSSMHVYTGIFACELALRFIAEGKELYLNSEHRLWNILDTFVVVMSLLEAVLHALDAGGNTNLTHVRIIRVARIVRIFRVLRVLHSLKPLRILLYCVLNTLRSLVWTMVLLLGILYIFGILFTQAAVEVLSLGRGHFASPSDQQSYDALSQHYGGLQWAVFTLFKAVSGGVSWQEVSAPLAFVHPFWEFIFVVFVSFTYFAVLNVVTGVFCQSAIESTQNDQDMVVEAQLADKKVYTQQLRELFQRIDSDNRGQVDFIMLESCLQDPECQAYFEVLGITSDDAWNLFWLLDDDDDCHIELEEFVTGCLKLRGAARSIDSHMLMHESRWTMRKVKALTDAFHELLEHLSSSSFQEGAPEPAQQEESSCGAGRHRESVGSRRSEMASL